MGHIHGQKAKRKGQGKRTTGRHGLLSHLRCIWIFWIVAANYGCYGRKSQADLGPALCEKGGGNAEGARTFLQAPDWRSPTDRSEETQCKAENGGQVGPTKQSGHTQTRTMAPIQSCNERPSDQGTGEVRQRDCRDQHCDTRDADQPGQDAQWRRGSHASRRGKERHTAGGNARYQRGSSNWRTNTPDDKHGDHGGAPQGTPRTDAPRTTSTRSPTAASLHDQHDEGAHDQFAHERHPDATALHSGQDESECRPCSNHRALCQSRCQDGAQEGPPGKWSGDDQCRGVVRLTDYYDAYRERYSAPGVTTTAHGIKIRSDTCEKGMRDHSSSLDVGSLCFTLSPRAILAPIPPLHHTGWTWTDNLQELMNLYHNEDTGQDNEQENNALYLLQNGATYLACIAGFAHEGHASWTEHFLEAADALPAPEPEQDLPPDYEARWTYVAHSTGLPIPELYPDTRIFRVRIGTVRHIPDALVNFPVGVDAWEALDHLVELWPDTAYHRGHIPWVVKKVHYSVANGLGTEAAIPSYILVTNDEKIEGPFRDILIEIQRHVSDKAEIEVGSWRIIARITLHSLLAQLRLSAPCTLTHHCDAWHNGYRLPAKGALLYDADFIIIEMLERQPIQLTGSTAPLTETLGATEAESTETPQLEVHQQAERATPGPTTFVIHRPRFEGHRPRICWLASDTRSNIFFHIAERHLPDLRNTDYHTKIVHESMRQDFPDSHNIQHSVLIADDDFVPKPQHRGVLVYLRIDRTQELYAAALSHRTSEHALLHWAGISVACCSDPRPQCGVWVNGNKITGSDLVSLTHADYVKIALWFPDTPQSELFLVDAPEEDIEEATYDQESPMDSLDYAYTDDEETESEATRLATDAPQDAYWIYAALYAWTGGCALLKMQTHQTKDRKKHIKRKGTRPKTWLLLGLILWQQAQPVATFVIHQNNLLEGRTERHYTRGAWDKLPPPGNPDDIHDSTSCITRTKVGQEMTDWITAQLTMQIQSQHIWKNLRDYDDTLQNDLSRTICTATTSRKTEEPVLPIQGDDTDADYPRILHLDALLHPSTRQHHDTDGGDRLQDHRHTNSIDTGWHTDDLEDLIMPWAHSDVPSLVNLQDLYPGTPDRFLTAKRNPHPQFLEIYTDGSFDSKCKDASLATWAIVICGKDTADGPAYLIDWFGDYVIDDPLEPFWVGALRHHIREAEATALIWTALYFIAHFHMAQVSVYSDALAVLNAAKGIWAVRPGEHIGVRLRSTYQLAERLKSRERLDCRHVKSHTGIYGNELADCIANALRTDTLTRRSPPRHYADWIQGDPPKIQRAHLLADSETRDDVPNMIDSHWTYQAPTFPTTPTKWMEEEEYTKPTQTMPLRIASYNVNSIRQVGAVATLRQQCKTQRIHIIGLQETRTADTTTYDTDYVRYVGGAVQGHGGVELWISTTLPTTQNGDDKDHFRRHDATVLHAEAEILLVALRIGGVPMLCAVAHAPHKGHPAAHIQDWWNSFKTLIRLHKRNRKILICIDANASVGPHEPHTGSLDAQDFDTAGTAMTHLMREHDMFAPSTFEDIHNGPSSTWHSAKTTNRGHRNDYILISLELKEGCTDSRTNYRLDAGNQSLDHTAVQVTINWNALHHRQRVRAIQWDRDKLRGADEETWQSFFQNWPSIPWETDVTTHMHLIEQHLHRQMNHFFPKDTEKKRHTCLDNDTMDIMKQRSQLKRILCDAKMQCSRHQLHATLTCWRTEACYAITFKEIVRVLRTTWRWMRYKELGVRVQDRIAVARAHWLEDQLQPLQQADKKRALMIMKPLRMGKRVKDLGKKPLQQVRLPDNSLANTPEEATTRWRNYFAELEGGYATTPNELWQQERETLRSMPPPPERLAEVPSLLEVERQLQRTASGKAVGPDRLPGELMKMTAPWLASAIWPLVAKTALWAAEPLQHKGGRLIVAYKNRGDHTQCHNHRALLVSSSLGKALHNVWRARTQPYVFQGATDMQFTAQPHSLVTQASHCVRMFLRSQIAMKQSCYAMFLDIQAAYYRLLRQHSIDSDFSDESIAKFLQRMGIHDLTIPELANILEGPNALDELQCPPHLKRLISSIHQSTWWKLDIDAVTIQTERGTRPGDGFADVLWQLCFSRFLHKVDDCLQSLDLQPTLCWNGVTGFSTAADGPMNLSMGTVVWADDAAVLGHNQDPDRIIPQLQVTAEVILCELHKLGMKPNMSKGKTEALIYIQGKGCKRIRQYLHHHCKSKIELNTGTDEMETLRIIPTYVHLGGLITHDATMRPEIRRKLALAAATLDNYKSKVLHNPQIPLEMRTHVFKATVAMVLNYNLGTWPSLRKGEQQLWCGGVFRLYRRLLAKHYSKDEQFHMTEDRLLSVLRLPHPEELLHAARLRQFSMCLRRTNRQFWAIAAQDEDWMVQVRHAARWIYMQIKGHTCLPPPETDEDLNCWQYYMANYDKFNRLVKRALHHAMLQRKIHSDVRNFHVRILDIMQQCGLRSHTAPEPEEQPVRPHRCIICRSNWPTYRAWAVHSFKSHGRLSAYRQLQLGNRCEACGRVFSNNARLTRHFRSVQRCAQTLAAQQRWEEPQPATGNRQVTDSLPYDSMIPSYDEAGPTLQGRSGWAMTNATMTALRALTAVDWSQDPQQPTEDLTDQLCRLPLHDTEFSELLAAQKAYYRGDPHAEIALQTFEDNFERIFDRPNGIPESDKDETRLKPECLQDLAQLYFAHIGEGRRGHPRFHYVLHLFAGAKRDGDLHSYVARASCPSGGMLFPVSLDVILDPVKGDLLSEEVQRYWINKSMQGLQSSQVLPVKLGVYLDGGN